MKDMNEALQGVIVGGALSAAVALIGAVLTFRHQRTLAAEDRSEAWRRTLHELKVAPYQDLALRLLQIRSAIWVSMDEIAPSYSAQEWQEAISRCSAVGSEEMREQLDTLLTLLAEARTWRMEAKEALAQPGRHQPGYDYRIKSIQTNEAKSRELAAHCEHLSQLINRELREGDRI
jgi:gas vesicle protein